MCTKAVPNVYAITLKVLFVYTRAHDGVFFIVNQIYEKYDNDDDDDADDDVMMMMMMMMMMLMMSCGVIQTEEKLVEMQNGCMRSP